MLLSFVPVNFCCQSGLTCLICEDVPDAVAGEHHELPIVVDRLNGNLGAPRDDLLPGKDEQNVID